MTLTRHHVLEMYPPLAPGDPPAQTPSSFKMERLPPTGPVAERRRDDRRQGRLNAELLTEVLNGNMDAVKRILEAGASVNATCRPTLTTALHLAIACGHEGVTRLLLARGADASRSDLQGRKGVHVAAATGNPEVLRLLLDHDPDMVNSQVVTSAEVEDYASLDCWSHDHSSVADKIPQVTERASPLHLAAQRVNFTCVKVLLDHGAKVDIKDGRDLTPLDVVGELTTKMDLINNLPSNNNNTILLTNKIKNQVFLPMKKAKTRKVTHKYKKTQKLFIKRKECQYLPCAKEWVNHTLETSDTTKIPSVTQNIISCLIANGAKLPTLEKNTEQGNENQVMMTVNCLHTAVQLEDLLLIETLIELGASPHVYNGEGFTPLHLAVFKHLLEPLRIILDKSKSKNVLDARDNQGRTPLHLAVAHDWFPGMSLLLEAGADVKITSNDGQTVLHMAVARHQPQMLEELLTIREAVNMIDARNKHQETPLCWAVSMGQLACAEVLLAKGADVTVKLPGKCTLLHLCAIRDHSSILERMLKYPRMAMFKNSRTNERNGGMTALHLAALKGFVSCVEVLLAAGCNVHEVTFKCPYRKSTPLHIAAMKGHGRIVEAILNHDINTLNAKNEDGWYPLHVAARFSNDECVRSMLLHGANLGAVVSDSEGRKRAAIDIIVCNILDPATFINNMFDHYIQSNEYPLNSNECEIKVKYDILQPLGPDRKQMRVLNSLLNCKKCTVQENVLLHPLVQSFLHLKWRKMRVLFFVIMGLYMLFTLSLTTTAMFYYVIQSKSFIIDYFVYGCHFTLGISLIVITLQELLQAVRMQRYYFKDLESWIKWSSFLLSFLVLVGHHPTDWLVQVSSVAVLLSWLELLFLLSRWPSSLGFYIVMFFTVARNVIKVLATFLFVILGFMFAFMIHFRDSDQFTDVWKSFTKVMVMMFELDYENMFRNTNRVNAAVGRGIFMYFMVLMAIVLMNLLVGLAVSDIAILEKQGRARRLAKQVDFLGMLELFVYNRYFFSCCPNELSTIIKRFRAVNRELKIFPGRPREKHSVLSESLKQSLINNIVKQTRDGERDIREVEDHIGDEVSRLKTL